MKKRIAWIDFLKGIMIICVIIGHTYPVDSIIRNIIFSFHMPLYFVLSGYTIKEISKKDILKSFVKDIRRLIVPAISTLFICGCIVVRKSDTFILDLLRFVLLRLSWGNGSDFNYFGYQLYGVGPVWFLLALFVAKIIYRILIRMRGEYRQVLILLGTLLGVILGNQTIVLPWNLDLIFIAMAFMELGFLLNKYEERFLKYIHIIAVLCFLGWSVLIYPFNYLPIEMAARMYPLGMLSIVEASFACVSISYIGKIICKIRGGYYWTFRNVFIRFIVYT